MDDEDYIRAALSMARRGLGRVAPNPSVGCVIVKKGVIIGRGRTHEGGRPHAEAVALAQAGHAARDATAYVTLEPCAVRGRAEPCAEALVQAGVKRVVIGCIDPNPLVNGQGVAILRAAGIEVTENVLPADTKAMNKGFFLKITEQRPLITLKMAVTNDGMTMPASGRREWITGPLARRHVHMERSKHDAVITAIGTVLNDDPLLTTRLPGVEHRPPRIVLDGKLEIPLDCQLIRTISEAPVWVFHQSGDAAKVAQLEKLGVRVFQSEYDLKPVLKKLAERGITRLFFEGGGTVLQEFVRSGYCDRFLLYKAPKVNWPGGRPLDFADIALKLGLKLPETRVLGEDLLEIYQR